MDRIELPYIDYIEMPSFIDLLSPTGMERIYDKDEINIDPSDGKIYLKDVYYGKQLPEVTVKPEPWLLDFIKNFGNKNIRLKYYHDGSHPDTYEDDYIDYGNIFDDPFIASNRGYSNDSRPVRLTDLNYLRRLYDVWCLAGKPKLVDVSNGYPWYEKPVNWLLDKILKLHNKRSSGMDGNRASYSLFYNTAYASDTDGFIHELCHPILDKFGKDTGILGAIKTMYYGDPDAYSTPGTYEYETHSVFQPQLMNYIYDNIIPDFIKNSPVITSYDDFK